MDIRQSTAVGAARSDIVIQPVRPAAAAPEPAPASTPLEPAVEVALSDEARRAAPDADTKRQFARDPESETIVYQVMDPVSGEVFMQLPDEATLRARIYARELEARTSAETTGSTVAVA